MAVAAEALPVLPSHAEQHLVADRGRLVEGRRLHRLPAHLQQRAGERVGGRPPGVGAELERGGSVVLPQRTCRSASLPTGCLGTGAAAGSGSGAAAVMAASSGAVAAATALGSMARSAWNCSGSPPTAPRSSAPLPPPPAAAASSSSSSSSAATSSSSLTSPVPCRTKRMYGPSYAEPSSCICETL